MTIFTRDLIHRIISCVLLPLFFFQCLPCVTSQLEWESEDSNKNNFGTGTMVAIILLGMFVTCLIFCFSFCALFSYYYRRLIEAEGHEEVLHSGATSGVEKEIIESFPFFSYSEVKELKIGKGGVECAICLKEFEDEDMVRWIPPCSHTFHVNCIDEWLSSRSTCPVCRANLSLKPSPSMDLEMGNIRRGVEESSDDISLIGNNVTWNNNANDRITRSRSTGSLSSWRMAKIFYTRSHSTGHNSLVQQDKNLDRFTLQLPEEVQRELVSLNLIRRSRMALPRAMSSRQGYRSGFSQGRRTLQRAISMSFSFQAASVRSTVGRGDLMPETSQAKDKEFGKGSF